MGNIIGAGTTQPGKGWKAEGGTKAITIDVDTSVGDFNAAFGAPAYTISLSGTGGRMWDAVGSSAVYSPTLTGFRVALRHHDGEKDLPVSLAEENGWYINWIGVQHF